MTLQAIRQRDGDSVTLLLEDGRELISDLSVVAELRLYAGKELDPAALRELEERTEFSRVRAKALALLSQRMHSEKELTDKLLRKGFDASVCESVRDWLREHSYLDDGRYAVSVVRHYAGKSYGEQRIRMELSRRGIARELWEDAFAEASETLPPAEEKLDRLVRGKLSDFSDPAAVRKVTASLIRRGYSWEDVRSAIERVKSEL